MSEQIQFRGPLGQLMHSNAASVAPVLPLVRLRERIKASLTAGGAGSGCHGDNCGRPSSGGKSTPGGKHAVAIADIDKKISEHSRAVDTHRTKADKSGDDGRANEHEHASDLHSRVVEHYGAAKRAYEEGDAAKGKRYESLAKQHADRASIYVDRRSLMQEQRPSFWHSLVHAGGPGSGCHGDNCGRPSTGGKSDGGVPKGYKQEGDKHVPDIQVSQYKLSPKQTRAETKFRDAITKDPEKYKAMYLAKFGHTLNADDAKELSPDYVKDRTNMAMAVHEPASWLIKQMFEDALKKPASKSGDCANAVVFTAGGAGSGKTTAINGHADVQHIVEGAHTVVDGTLRPAAKAVDYVNRTLAAGKEAVVLFVHRDPIESFTNGVLSRAMRTGRTVPLEEFAHQHSGIQQSMAAVNEKFKNNPDFHFRVLDNSAGKGGSKITTLDKISPDVPLDRLRNMLKLVLEREYKSGKISRAVYKAVKGKDGNQSGEHGV